MMMLALLAIMLAQAPAAQIQIHGIAQDTDDKPVAGVRLEFLLQGSPKKEAAVTGEDGKYALTLPAGYYEIVLNLPDPQVPPKSGRAWLAGREEAVLNARIPKTKFEGQLEYDFLGEWRVVDERGRGVGGARVTIESLDRAGRRATFPLYIPVDEGEKQNEGAVQAAPDGRFVFRIRETQIVPDEVAALIVTVDAPGFAPRSVHVFPVLQFSETGHLYEAYPEEYVIPLKKK